ncbi:MAG: ParB/RepB/Spo0J family partition protein [Syntrophorhabdaceae bacterium]|nr:ParB/RepB/Spo0J family partition protein [Syntrophorhabdaceae bacterium]
MNGKNVFTGITDDAGTEQQMAIGFRESQMQLMDVTKIIPNGLQPRRSYDEGKLELLTESVKQDGVLQPIIVKRRGESYLIVAGERRWRAACKAGLRMIPVIIKDDDDATPADEVAVLENMQRESLNTVDEIYMIKEFFDRGKDIKRIMVLTARSRSYLYVARRIAGFFVKAVAGNFATYDSLMETCRRFGIKTLEQAVRVWETTDDLQSAMYVLEKDTSAAVRETAEIAVAEAEEHAEGTSGKVKAPAEAPVTTTTAGENGNGAAEELPVASMEPVHDPIETVEPVTADPPVTAQDDDVAEELVVEQAVEEAGDRPLDPLAHDPAGEVEQVTETRESGSFEPEEIEGKSATKYTQNAEIPLQGEDETPFDNSVGEVEKPPETGTFSDTSAPSFPAPESPFERDGSGPEGGENAHKISGKLLLKEFASLKEHIENLSGVQSAALKVRENHRETLAALVRDVEFLLPSLTGAISAIEAHLSAIGRKKDS